MRWTTAARDAARERTAVGCKAALAARVAWGCAWAACAWGCGSSSGKSDGGTPLDGSASTAAHGRSDAAGPTSPGVDAAGANANASGGDAGTAGGRSDAAAGALPGADASAAMAPPSGPYAWSNVAIGGGGFVSGIVFSPVEKGLVYARTDVGGLYRWEDAQARWTALTDSFPMSLGNDLGGESIAVDPVQPGVLYAAAGMYLASGDGVILRSSDHGDTWTVHSIGVAMGGNENGRGMGERLAVDPKNPAVLLFGSRNDGLFRSADSAASWSPVSGFPTKGDATYGLPVVVFDPSSGAASGSTTIYVAAASKAAGSNLYRTTDGGGTWAVVPGGPSGLMAHHACLGSDGALWLAYSSDYGPFNVGGGTLAGQVWKYAAGAWSNVTPPAGVWGGMAGGISVDAQNPLHAMVSTLDWYAPDRVLATTDGGATWTVVAEPPVSWNANGSTYDVNGAQYWLVSGGPIGTGATNWVEALALDPFDPAHAIYGTGAGVWASSNLASATGTVGQGVTWTFSDEGLEETVPLFLGPAVHGAFLGAIGDLGGMRNDSLTTYSTTGEYANPVFSNTNAIDFAEAEPNFVVRVGDSGTSASDVAYSTDNGQTWTPCPTAPPGYSGPNEMQSVAVAADGSRFVVAAASGHGGAALTSDRCATWTASAGLPSGAQLAADRVSASTFYATSGGTLYASTDGGATFASASTFTGAGAPRPVFGQAGEVWVAAGGGNLYRFTGGGAMKLQIQGVSAAYGVGFGKAASGQTHPAVFLIGTVGGQYGFFRSDDGAGASWTRVNDDAHQYGWLQGDYVAGDEDTFGRMYLTTSGRGYVYGDPR